MNLGVIDENDTFKVVSDLKSSASPGPDNISAMLLNT